MPTIISYADTNIPTVDEIRNRWCFGLPLIKDDGVAMSDADLGAFITKAVRLVERQLGILLKPTVIAANPYERGLVEGTDYEVAEPPAWPYIAPSSGNPATDKGSLWDYLGLPSPLPTGVTNLGVSVLPFAAYQKVYSEVLS